MSVISVTDRSFEQVLRENKLVLVDFWAPWCGPCRMIAPILEELEKQMKGQVVIAKINVDENPGSAQKYAIRSIPNLKLFKNGKEVANVVGVQPLSQLKSFIQRHL